MRLLIGTGSWVCLFQNNTHHCQIQQFKDWTLFVFVLPTDEFEKMSLSTTPRSHACIILSKTTFSYPKGLANCWPVLELPNAGQRRASHLNKSSHLTKRCCSLFHLHDRERQRQYTPLPQGLIGVHSRTIPSTSMIERFHDRLQYPTSPHLASK